MRGLLVGLGAAVAASALYSVAVGLQALEARRVPAEHSLRFSLLSCLARRPLWILGTAIGLLGWGLQAVALSFAPLTLVAPTLAVSLVFLLVVGAYALEERVGRRDVLGVLAVAVGVVGLGWAAPAHSTRHAGGTGLIVAAAALGALVVAPYFVGERRRSSGLLVAASAGVAYACAGLSTKFAADDFSTSAWAGLAAWLAALGVVSGIGVLSEMTALQTRPVTQVAPIVFGLIVLVPVALAPALAGEPWSFPPGVRAVLLLSLVAVVGGVITLSRSRAVGAVLAAEAAGSGIARA